tara:strand:- start:16125 stop:17468 length:1344 start_codon:yes stop_codon:yes gene_type:complete
MVVKILFLQQIKMMSGIVAIVGRPNVGKSTFFNRMIQKRDAIVDSQSGVTRDRHYGKSDWNGREFTIIDTGGYLENSDDVFQKEIDKQVSLAVEEADVIVFIVDVTDGVTGMDQNIAKLLRRSQKPVYLTINKVDNTSRAQMTSEFYTLGYENFYCISSVSGSGTGELLDDLISCMPNEEKKIEDEIPNFAVVGRPNAGKSSFINAIIGQERNIVTKIAGTTRDSINSRYKKFGFDFNLVDTAGIRKKAKIKEDIEFYSIMRSVRSIEYADVCILIIDATRGFDGQVQNIFWLIHRNNKGIIILVNKWDLLKKSSNVTKKYEIEIREAISPFKDIPIVFISSLNKQRIFKAVSTAIEVFNNRKRKIPTKTLNNEILPFVEKTPPPSSKGKYIKIKFCTQLPTNYPQFVFFCNLPQYIKDPYRRFLENKIRSKFNFQGVPIQIFFRKK